MTSPICDFVKNYINKKTVRLHMPGHKGNMEQMSEQGFIPGIFPYDITEIRGADYLYQAQGIIAESEKNASRIFHSLQTIYSTEGSSICIKTMLAACAMRGDTVICVGQTHRAYADACFLIGLHSVRVRDLRFLPQALSRHPEAKAVYITAVDYLGYMEDIEKAAEITHSFGKILIADNAHGAYLNFLNDGKFHPNKCGADLVCDSAHKTLPVLTGGAYLHITNSKATVAPKFVDNLKQKMIIFGSTSPSYLILQSLDYANSVFADRAFSETMAKAAEKVSDLKREFGITTAEPLKCVFMVKNAPEPVFEEFGIEPEQLIKTPSGYVIILMFSPLNSDTDFEKTRLALKNLEIVPDIEITDNLLRKCGKSE
jgi:arginine/lysine/ornithine decarboxylase